MFPQRQNPSLIFHHQRLPYDCMCGSYNHMFPAGKNNHKVSFDKLCHDHPKIIRIRTGAGSTAASAPPVPDLPLPPPRAQQGLHRQLLLQLRRQQRQPTASCTRLGSCPQPSSSPCLAGFSFSLHFSAPCTSRSRLETQSISSYANSST